MSEFRTSLVREKFIIHHPDRDPKEDPNAVIALSNRMVVPLVSDNGQISETFVVRTQNMHSCVRMGAMISKEFFEDGPLLTRQVPFKWNLGWEGVTKAYEKKHNPDLWGVVYNNGRIIYEDQAHHPFLDVIEKCDARNKKGYEESIRLAEDAFGKAGKRMAIHHDSNVALIVSIAREEAKCGVILRSAARTNTFNFTVKNDPDHDEEVRVPSVLTVCAAFLEGIQLAFKVGMANKKRSFGLIERFSEEDKAAEAGSHRMGRLNKAITTFEDMYMMHYRPERPSFSDEITNAERFAAQVLKPKVAEMMRRGKLDQSEWVE